jgi:hypothetical protein
VTSEPEPEGRVKNTGPGPLVAFAAVALLLGWALRPLSLRLDATAPRVGWLPVGALFFVAAFLGWLAWSTYVMLHRRRLRLEPHKAVNRLVLAKSCALAGAAVAGGYAGYALSWLGSLEAELARDRFTHSLIAALAGVLIVTGSLLLERACRVPPDRD